MKAQIIEKVKANRGIYKIYYYFASTLVNVLKLFLRPDDKLILFVSYGGRYFNDSPKFIYEAMKKDNRFKDYKLVWAFRTPDKFDVKDKVCIDTLSYYITALKARCWVTNVLVERGLNFKGKNTYYFHTTHGTLPKLNGNDVRDHAVFGWNFKYKYDCSCAQSEEEKRLQLSMYNLTEEKVLVCGYPKNDVLAGADDAEKIRIRNKLGLPQDKKVILYAPTFREDNTSQMNSPVDFKKWETVLGKEYIVLFRAHPTVINKTNIDSSSGFVYDYSSYSDNTELMIASDILISDYSGIFFEFAILHRPMYCFAYDYDEYSKKRGLYFDLRKELPGGSLNENELLQLIKMGSTDEINKKIDDFLNKYITAYGSATEQAINNIYDVIS